MTSRKLLVPALVCAALLAGAAAVANAAPPSEGSSWSFVDCSGPAGTPSDFAATHESSNGSAFRLADGATVFVVLVFVDVTAGKEFRPPGHEVSGNAQATCTTVNPFTGHTLQLSGFFTST